MANEAAGGTGAPAGGDTTQGTGGGTGTGAADANGGGQQPVAGQGTGGNGNGQGGQGGQKVYTYNEDRSDYIPRHRLNEATGKLKAELDALKTQLAEQGGITTRLKQAFSGEPSDADKQTQEIKAALLQMFPGLDAVGELSKEQLQEVMAAAREAQQSASNHWTQHATRMLDTLSTEVQTALGVAKLSDTQSRRLRAAYRDELAAAVQARNAAAESGAQYDASNDALAKHERGDVGFIKEFAKAFLDDWFEPARRSATQAQLRRNRPVPSGSRTGSPALTTTAPDIDYNNEDAFKKALAEARGQG
jgi:hypothetical protein